ncbi:MAG: WXG100 family type VII secretion target [Methanosarcinaceae archaeon]|nr:WXG100 family type VII secretion target [Methanosarcinaceae archaeon]
MSRSRSVLKLDGDALNAILISMDKFTNQMDSNLSVLTSHVDELTSPEVWEADAVLNFKERFEEIKRKEKELIEDMQNLRKELDREYMDWWVTSQDFFVRSAYTGFHIKG